MPGSQDLNFQLLHRPGTFVSSTDRKHFLKLIIFNNMKKVAFTLGLALFAIGLFAQNSPATGTNNAKATSAPVTTVKKESMKPAQSAPAKPAAEASTGKSVYPATTPKPAAKPVGSSAKAKPATGSTTPPVKKHRRHKAKSTAPAGSTAPATTPKHEASKSAAPKTSKQ